MKTFTKSFTQQEPIPEVGIERAVELMRSGRLHRYDRDPGDDGEVGRLEREFAGFIGVPFCLACASGGYAIHIALRAAGVKTDDTVLTNAFTLAPVPGAIHNSGARPVFVEMTDDLCIDLKHLDRMASESRSRFLLLSHMRGHMADMDRVLEICQRHDLFLIEDCAHTMGASWNGRPSGSDADIACFSTQTYKHINSGEGGLLTTRHSEIMARAVMLSGSYMLYDRHPAGPPDEEYRDIRLQTPNLSGRMDHLRAAILRPQLADLPERCKRWNERYETLATRLSSMSGLHIPERKPEEQFVGSSLQFSLPDLNGESIARFIRTCAERGVVIKWFGDPEPHGYTSRYDSWRYLEETPDLPQTDRICNTLCDLRIPLTFTEEDCQLIVEIISEELK
ncbi:MAG: DegT/DnrJ/EryC1/StrS family aminotransferase [Limisphaerales bacterium]